MAAVPASVFVGPQVACSSAPAGRHRKPVTARDRIGRAVDVVAHAGGLVTLASLMVFAATAGGVVDGTPASSDPTVSVTFDGGTP